jgi:hypothetical protein
MDNVLLLPVKKRTLDREGEGRKDGRKKIKRKEGRKREIKSRMGKVSPNL